MTNVDKKIQVLMNSSDDFCIKRNLSVSKANGCYAINNLEIELKTKHFQIDLHLIQGKKNLKKMGKKKDLEIKTC